jgi:hypothetical protein
MKKYFDDQSFRVFCISIQRTGTTSVGKFFRDFGFSWAGWPADESNNWSYKWYDGMFEKIFSSDDFRSANAFEDSPWFAPDFYKVLYNRFPNSKFILFTRNPDLWFSSMIKHSKGDVIGITRVHCKFYRREPEFFELLSGKYIIENIENKIQSPKTMKIIGLSNHYKGIYNLHNTEVKDFFIRNDPKKLFVGELEDTEKWIKLGKFLDIKVDETYRCHENASD